MILKGFNVCRLNDSVVRCRSHGIVPIKAVLLLLKSICSCDTISLTSIQFVFMTDFLSLSIGSALLWSSVIMMLFKYQSCGLESFVSEPEKNDLKIPLVDRSQNDCLMKGEPILV